MCARWVCTCASGAGADAGESISLRSLSERLVLATSKAQQAGCVTTFVGRCGGLRFVCMMSSYKCHSVLDDMYRDIQAEQQPWQVPTPSPTAEPTPVSKLDSLLMPL